MHGSQRLECDAVMIDGKRVEVHTDFCMFLFTSDIESLPQNLLEKIILLDVSKSSLPSGEEVASCGKHTLRSLHAIDHFPGHWTPMVQRPKNIKRALPSHNHPMLLFLPFLSRHSNFTTSGNKSV